MGQVARGQLRPSLESVADCGKVWAQRVSLGRSRAVNFLGSVRLGGGIRRPIPTEQYVNTCLIDLQKREAAVGLGSAEFVGRAAGSRGRASSSGMGGS